MTLSAVKKKVVDEERWTTPGSLYHLVVRVALGILFVGITCGLLVSAVLSFKWTMLILVLCAALFIFSFDFMTEDKKSFLLVVKVAKYWWLMPIISVVTFILLRLFNF